MKGLLSLNRHIVKVANDFSAESCRNVLLDTEVARQSILKIPNEGNVVVKLQRVGKKNMTEIIHCYRLPYKEEAGREFQLLIDGKVVIRNGNSQEPYFRMGDIAAPILDHIDMVINVGLNGQKRAELVQGFIKAAFDKDDDQLKDLSQGQYINTRGAYSYTLTPKERNRYRHENALTIVLEVLFKPPEYSIKSIKVLNEKSKEELEAAAVRLLNCGAIPNMDNVLEAAIKKGYLNLVEALIDNNLATEPAKYVCTIGEQNLVKGKKKVIIGNVLDLAKVHKQEKIAALLQKQLNMQPHLTDHSSIILDTDAFN